MKPTDEQQLLRQIPAPLLIWYDSGARVLPWRSQPTPYRVWVSEIMLQQTRVEAVLPYFQRFLEALPDIQSLAQAPEQLLLKLWQGLGYYNRVRNLQKAAQIVVDQYGGRLPDQPAELKKLPGIGDYSAGAIASIAYNQPVPAVDGNVLRVLSRLLGSRQDIAAPPVKKQMAQLLEQIIPPERPGDFNQALMELGALVCLPNGKPLCESCPLSALCQGYQQGIQQQLPVKAPKKPRKQQPRTLFLLWDGSRILLRQRPGKGLLRGLWEFPGCDSALDSQQARQALEQAGVQVESMESLGQHTHVFTHIEWHMTAYLAHCAPFPAPEACIWATPEQLQQDYPLPSAFSFCAGAALQILLHSPGIGHPGC